MSPPTEQGTDDALVQPYSRHPKRESQEVYSRLVIGEAQQLYEQVIRRFS